jgi:hypothetical protein
MDPTPRAIWSLFLGIPLAAAIGCGGSPAPSTGSGGGSTSAATTSGTGAGSVTGVRGDRYCEILIGKLDGTNIDIDIYNTYLLNDCPEAAWTAVDPAQVKAEQMADAVILNGPRYWLMDAFENTALVDTTPHTIGGIEMRLAGTLTLPVAEVQGGEKPYVPRDVARTTTWIYEAGKPVYELVDPQNRVFDMQSYSTQSMAQTIDSLAGLASMLSLPVGWQFRTRTLDAELSVTAVNGVATVVQDDFGNTYQLSQQTP